MKKDKEEILKAKREYFQTQNGKFSKYKTKAKERKIDFSLTKEEFLNFWQIPCFYCQSPIETIGLDRIINNKGYFIGNVVSCCSVCNILKNNLKIDEWLEYLKQINIFNKYGNNRTIVK